MTDSETRELAKGVFRQYQEAKSEQWKKQLAIHQKFLFNSRQAGTPDPGVDTELAALMRQLDRTEEKLIHTLIEQDSEFALSMATAAAADAAALVASKTAASTFYQKLWTTYKAASKQKLRAALNEPAKTSGVGAKPSTAGGSASKPAAAAMATIKESSDRKLTKPPSATTTAPAATANGSKPRSGAPSASSTLATNVYRALNADLMANGLREPNPPPVAATAAPPVPKRVGSGAGASAGATTASAASNTLPASGLNLFRAVSGSSKPPSGAASAAIDPDDLTAGVHPSAVAIVDMLSQDLSRLRLIAQRSQTPPLIPTWPPTPMPGSPYHAADSTAADGGDADAAAAAGADEPELDFGRDESTDSAHEPEPAPAPAAVPSYVRQSSRRKSASSKPNPSAATAAPSNGRPPLAGSVAAPLAVRRPPTGAAGSAANRSLSPEQKRRERDLKLGIASGAKPQHARTNTVPGLMPSTAAAAAEAAATTAAAVAASAAAAGIPSKPKPRASSLFIPHTTQSAESTAYAASAGDDLSPKEAETRAAPSGAGSGAASAGGTVLTPQSSERFHSTLNQLTRQTLRKEKDLELAMKLERDRHELIAAQRALARERAAFERQKANFIERADQVLGSTSPAAAGAAAASAKN